jgi:CelD/BcsL family acetyltransferase involved in cellulose biosynthesis
MSVLSLAWKNFPASSLHLDSHLAHTWNTLNACRGDLPILTAEAVVAALQTFGTGTERLLVGTANGATVAMFVLEPQAKFRWQTFQPSQLPLGTWVAASDYALTDIVYSLQRGPLGLCLVLSITQVDPLYAPRPDDAANTSSADYIETGWIDVVGNFEDYWNARGKNLRQNMRKQRNKLGTEGVALAMDTWTAVEDMAPAIARYGALESQGWKAAKGTAIHLDNEQGKFYRKLFETAAQRGEAVIYEYRFGDKTVAVNLCVRRASTLVILKTTYDESIQAYSPAFMLSQDAMENLYAAGKTARVEYYGRLMEWHTKWTDQKRTLYHLTAYRWPLVKQVALARRAKVEATSPQEPATQVTSAASPSA